MIDLTPGEPPPTEPLGPSRGRRMVVAFATVPILLVAIAVGLTMRGGNRTPNAAVAEASSAPTPHSASSTVPEPTATSPATPMATTPPGRLDVPKQPGTASNVIVVVDASEIDPSIAAGVRDGLIDLVHQLPDYDALTLIATADTATIRVDRAELKGEKREDAIEAIRGMPFGGKRNLLPGLRGAAAKAVEIGPGAYDVLLIASGADGTTRQQVHDAIRPTSDANGSSSVAIDLHTVAIGSGDHEALLARSSPRTYQWARTPADITMAMVPYRLAVSEATLLAVGRVPDTTGPVRAIVGPDHFGIRFSVVSPGRVRGLEVKSPTGRTYTVDSHDDGVTVQEVGERVSIVINGADPGGWLVTFTGSEPSPSAWFEVDETLSLVDPLLTAYATGDTSEDLRFGVGLWPQTLKLDEATALYVAPDGTEHEIAMRELGQDDLNIGGDVLVVGNIIDKPDQAGSYRLILSVDQTDAGGTHRAYSWIMGAFVAPLRDSDGDGIRDSLEEHNGLDPADPRDGATDHDFDGLSTSKELVETGTLPGEWDTDRGGESDGSEITAGRDPKDPKDDQPAKTCVELIPQPSTGATVPPTPAATPLPAPELEAVLPNEVLGRGTEKSSMRAPADLGFVFGLFDAFLACTDKQRQDLSMAFAVAAELNSWSVVAVQIDGVTGEEMADIWLFRMTRGPTAQLTKKTVDGRAYWLSDVGWAVYATDDTFFWISSLAYGDFPPPNPPPIPDSTEIVEAYIRQLPIR